ncbi:MAG TPA: alpha/beta hydrolase [Anaeromyxobacter sp.]|nr:alpha/beta hydrolase [Anaeromyxobacter sp.]
MTPRVLFVPGIGDSGPDHWQSIWAASLPGSIWVEQRDWDRPVRDEWVAALARDLRRVEGPKVIVGHSLGCLVVAEAAELVPAAGVTGALLVAVPDTQGSSFPAEATGFRPALSLEVPIPSLLVASTDDPYGTHAHSEAVARRWGSELVSVGAKGHVNARSSLGAWAEGRALLERLTGGPATLEAG